MWFLQQFHLVIEYKKGSTHNLEDIISWKPTSKITSFGALMHIDPFTHDAYIQRGIHKRRGLQGGVPASIGTNSYGRR
jgi:hypothetical protein